MNLILTSSQAEGRVGLDQLPVGQELIATTQIPGTHSALLERVSCLELILHALLTGGFLATTTAAATTTTKATTSSTVKTSTTSTTKASTTTTSKSTTTSSTAASGTSAISSYAKTNGLLFEINGKTTYFMGTNSYWIGFLTNNADVDLVMSHLASVRRVSLI